MKSIIRILLVVLSIIVSWQIVTEFLFPGSFEKTIIILTNSPLGFMAVLSLPMVSFFAATMVWRTVLTAYGYRISPATLKKYVLGDFGISFLVPFFGGLGRLTRVILLTSAGVKAGHAFSSVVIDSLIFSFQAVVTIGVAAILIDIGVIRLDYAITIWLKTFLWLATAGFVFFLAVAKLGWIKGVQSLVKKFTQWKKLLDFLEGLNDGFLKMFTIPKRTLLLISLWMFIWSAAGFLEIVLITNLVGIKIEVKTLFLLYFAISTLFVVLPNTPLGIGTMDALMASVFLSGGLNIALIGPFVMLWRLKNIVYSVSGLVLIGDSVLTKLNIFNRKRAQK